MFQPSEQFETKLKTWIASLNITPRNIKTNLKLPLVTGRFGSDIEMIRARFFRAFSPFYIGGCTNDLVLLSRAKSGGPEAMPIQKYMPTPKAISRTFDSVTVWSKGKDALRVNMRLEHFISKGCRLDCCMYLNEDGERIEMDFLQKVQSNMREQIRTRDIALNFQDPLYEEDVSGFEFEGSDDEDINSFAQNEEVRNFDDTIKEGLVRSDESGKPVSFQSSKSFISRSRKDKYGGPAASSTFMVRPSRPIPSMTSMLAEPDDDTYIQPDLVTLDDDDIADHSDDSIDTKIDSREVRDIINESLEKVVEKSVQRTEKRLANQFESLLESNAEKNAREIRENLKKYFDQLASRTNPSTAPGQGAPGASTVNPPQAGASAAPGQAAGPPQAGGPASSGLQQRPLGARSRVAQPSGQGGVQQPGQSSTSTADNQTRQLIEKVTVLTQPQNQRQNASLGLGSGTFGQRPPTSGPSSITSSVGSMDSASDAGAGRSRVMDPPAQSDGSPDLLAFGVLQPISSGATSGTNTMITPSASTSTTQSDVTYLSTSTPANRQVTFMEVDNVPQVDGNGSLDLSQESIVVNKQTRLQLLPSDENSPESSVGSGSLTSQFGAESSRAASDDTNAPPVESPTPSESMDQGTQAVPLMQDATVSVRNLYDIRLTCNLTFLISGLMGAPELSFHWSNMSSYNIFVSDENVFVVVAMREDDMSMSSERRARNVFDLPGEEIPSGILFDEVLEEIVELTREGEAEARFNTEKPIFKIILNDENFVEDADSIEVRYFPTNMVVSAAWSNKALDRLLKFADQSVPERLIATDMPEDAKINLKRFFGDMMKDPEAERKLKFTHLLAKISRVIELFYVDAAWRGTANHVFGNRMRKTVRVKVDGQDFLDLQREMMLDNVDMDEQTDDEYQESGYEGRYLELGSAANGRGQPNDPQTQGSDPGGRNIVGGTAEPMNFLAGIVSTPANMARRGISFLGSLGSFSFMQDRTPGEIQIDESYVDTPRPGPQPTDKRPDFDANS